MNAPANVSKYYIEAILNGSCNPSLKLQSTSIHSSFSNITYIGSNGVEAFNQANISIFPNPFSTVATLESNGRFDNMTLWIDNCLGQPVKQIANLSGQKIVFTRENLSSGVYFLRLTQAQRTVSINKILIMD
jgi:hypothetical protein